ncbi:MAG: VWA domain-containing protein [Candidatus Eisenbacteria bacterium]
MTFAEPTFLLGLLALPLAIVVHWLAIRRGERRLTALAGTRVPSALLAQRRPGERRLGAALAVVALAALIVGAAGPEWGRELTRRQGAGSDVLFVIDCSASMDARDVSPSRLAEARREALALIERLEGSRVGVIAFAGDAERLVPLTQDLSAVRLTLENLSSQTIAEPGSDLGRALRMTMKVLPRGRREEQIVILWTDGEDLEAAARPALDELAATGIRVFAVGVGTPAGDVVPVLDDAGRVTDIKRDETGTAVKSRLDEGLLRSIARRTHGGYFAATRAGGELPRLLAALSGIKRSSRASRLVERRVARFPLFAGVAAALLGLTLVRPRRRPEVALPPRAGRSSPAGGEAPAAARKPSGKAGRTTPAAARKPSGKAGRVTPVASKKPPGKAGVAASAAFAVLMAAEESGAQSDWARGDAAFRRGEYAQAESLYSRRARRGSSAELQVNRATARALMGERETASNDFARLTDSKGRAGREARYNLGTVLGERREFTAALARLREALARDPKDGDARWNYEVLLRQRQQEENRKEPSGPPPPEPPQKPDPSPSPSAPDSPKAPPPDPQSGGSPRPAPGSTGQQGMTREQAQQLLAALEEMQRADHQRQQKVRVLRDRRGRDW